MSHSLFLSSTKNSCIDSGEIHRDIDHDTHATKMFGSWPFCLFVFKKIKVLLHSHKNIG